MGLNKDISSTFFTRIVTVIIAFAKTILIAKFLGVEGNGEYAIFTASVGLFILILGFGIDTATVFYVSKKEIAPQPLFITFIIFSVVVCLLFFCFMHGLHSYIRTSIFLPNSRINLQYEFLLVASLFLMLISKLLQAFFKAFKNFTQLNSILLINGFLTVSLFGGLFFIDYFHKSIADIWIFYIYALVQFSLVCLLLYHSKDYISLNKFSLLTKSQILSLITFGGLAYLANIIQFLNYRLDYWFIEYFTDAKQLGTYSLAVSFIQMIWLLPGSVATVMFPYVANKEGNDISTKIIRISKLVFYFLILLFIISFLSMSSLVNILFGEEFNETTSLFWILLSASVPLSYSIIFASYFAGINRIDINFKGSFLGLIVTIFFDILLIPKNGNIGAAYATSLSYLVTTIYSIYYMNKLTNISFYNYFTVNKLELHLFKMAIKRYTKNLIK